MKGIRAKQESLEFFQAVTSEIYHKKYVFSTLSKQYLLGQLYLTQEVLLQIFPEIVSKYHSDMS